MIELHPVTLEDKAWIDPLVWAEGSSSADFNFGNIYLWDQSFHQLVGRLDDRVIVLPCYGEEPFFAWPAGTGDLVPVMAELERYAKEHGFPFTLRGVTQEHLPLLDRLFPGRCEVVPERPLWDYIYSAEKLDTLSGKKLHGKRNHINRFEEENDWSFRPLTPADFSDCIRLLDEWNAMSHDENSEVDADAADEYTAICRALEHYEALGMEGGILRVSGQPVAFTLGEPVCAHTFVVHFEKAHSELNGAYPMINREFVRYIRKKYPAVQWINREDDMGMESLRRAKESYHPDHMVEKYKAVIRDV
ncbi:MAG: DUF2156 domain-containing protein [Oscillospiraceae bacterium]|nr:DUF2156 domain-containing protein [Oscillospiraceae bacterium]